MNEENSDNPIDNNQDGTNIDETTEVSPEQGK